jgi:hypothetical protein
LDFSVRIILLLTYSGLFDGSFYKQRHHLPNETLKRTLESRYNFLPNPIIDYAGLRAREGS